MRILVQHLLAVALGGLLLNACAREGHVPDTAMSLLTRADSTVVWTVGFAVVGDIDCDGRPDTAVVGRAGDNVQVGIVFGALKSPHIATIPVAPEAQGALPTPEVRLAPEDIDYDPASDEDGPGPLEGFRRSATCIGLNLSDGETDSMHMYWNHERGLLDWWRR
jgi:hypothetical protein